MRGALRRSLRGAVPLALASALALGVSVRAGAESLVAEVPTGSPLPDAVLDGQRSPSPGLMREIEKFMRARDDESVEVRAFTDEEIHRRVLGGSPPPVAPQRGDRPAFFGFTEVQECNGVKHVR